jgi:hypothetical protein
MGLTNKEKYEILNPINRILKEERGLIKEDFESTFNRLTKDIRSKDTIFELESYLMSVMLNSDYLLSKKDVVLPYNNAIENDYNFINFFSNDLIETYINLIDNNDDFVSLLKNGYATMYIYCSKEINNPFVCNDYFKLAIDVSTKKYLKRSKRDLRKQKFQMALANIKHIFKEYEQEEKNLLEQHVLKKNRK